MKKTTVFLCVILVLALLPATAAGAASWADDAMKNLTERKIIDELPENPGAPITREAFCVMLAKAALHRTGASTTLTDPADANIFADTDEIKSENIPYIMYLFDQRILTGAMVNGERHMLPGSLLTRQDAAAFLGRWLGLDPERNTDSATAFIDNGELSNYARSIVYQLADMGIISGYPNGSFRPRNNISYAETSALIHKTMNGKLLLSYFGDGDLGNADGYAFETRFALPSGLCFDNNGNLIVFDTFNASVKRIDKNATTILGFSQVIDDFGFVMPKYHDDVRASALFGRPTDGVTAPNGDLFIVDSANHAIRLLRDDIVYTFAGGTQGYADGSKGTVRFNNPTAIAIDKNGNLIVADTLNHAIRRITPNGVVSTVAGRPGTAGNADGRGSAALFNDPSGIAVDTNGVIYVADTGNHLIRKIENGNVTTIAKNTEFDSPRGLYWAEGVLFIADMGNHTVKALTANGNVITVAGTGSPGDADGSPGNAMMNRPSAVVYKNGVLFIADTRNNKIKTVWLDAKSLNE